MQVLVTLLLILIVIFGGVIWLSDTRADYEQARAAVEAAQAAQIASAGQAVASLGLVVVVILLVVALLALLALAGYVFFLRYKLAHPARALPPANPTAHLARPGASQLPAPRPGSGLDALAQLMAMQMLRDMQATNRLPQLPVQSPAESDDDWMAF
jgi:hypothetical protein